MAVYIRHQHEHWDGSGRPGGLAGDAIPVGSRILAATNLFDELSEGMPDVPAVTPAEAFDRIQALAGKVLDPAVVTALQKVLERRRSTGIRPPV